MGLRRAVIYVRISDDKRRGSLNEGVGVTEQESKCRKLARERGYEVVRVFVDNDLSAYSGKPRQDYLRMLTFLREGGADVVLCWHTDRLHRDNTELEDYIKVVEPREIPTESVTAGMLDLNTPIGRMVARNLCTIARYESEHRAERVRVARERQAREGKYGGGSRRPYGFEKDGVTPIDAEYEITRRMGRAVLADVSLKSIARDLRLLGILTSSGTQFTSDGVRAVLLRPRNAGFMVHRESGRTRKRKPYMDDDIVGIAPWPKIFEEDEWRAIVAKLIDPNRTTNTSPSPAAKYLGSGIYRCPCGATMRANTAGRQAARPVYRCKQTGSGHVTVPMAPMDEWVEYVIFARMSEPDAGNLLATTNTTVDVPALRQQLATHRTRLEQITDDFNADRITRSQMLSMTADRRKKITAIEDQLAEVSAISPLVALIGATDVQAEWKKLTLGERREAVKATFTITVLPIGPGRRVPMSDRVKFEPARPKRSAA